MCRRWSACSPPLPRVLILYIILLVSPHCRTIAAAAASSASVSAPASIEASPAPAANPTIEGGGGNPVTQLIGFVWDQIVRMKDGSVQLYTNHKSCNEIRSKQRLHAEALGERRGPTTGGITYEQFDFLQRGKDDRGKLGSLLFMMFFAPNFLPYAIMFNPGMMPSPFKVPPRAGAAEETKWERISRERTHAVIRTMLDMERAAHVAPALSKINPFGGGKTRKAMERMGRMGALGGTILALDGASGLDGGEVVMDALADQIFTAEQPDKKKTQLVVVPKPIMKGLAHAIEADSPPSNFMPTFLLRGQVINHIQKVASADEFLVRQKVDLSTIDDDLLVEACSARLIGGPGRSSAELREGLSRWLKSVVLQPEKKLSSANSMHYNGNLARAALMCYQAVDGSRDARASSYLPRLLFQGQYGGQVIKQMEDSKNSKGKKKKRGKR